MLQSAKLEGAPEVSCNSQEELVLLDLGTFTFCSKKECLKIF